MLVASVGAWIAACSDGSTGPELGPSAPNRPPAATGTIPAQEVAVGATATVDVASYFTDPDGDRLTYSTESSDVAVATAGVSGSTVSLTGIAAGSATLTVMATDPDGLRATQSLGVTVPNRAPEPTDVFPDLELAVGEQATVDVANYFTDPDGDPLTFAAESSDPAVATANLSGTSVTVEAVTASSATITVTAADTAGLEVSQSFDVTVPNRTPEITDTIPALELAVGNDTTVDVSGYFSDPDEDPLTFEAESSQADVAGTETSGSIITVTAVAAGTTTITVTATDPGGLAVAQSFEVTVPNRAPEITNTIPSVEVEAGDEATVDVSEYFTDPDEDPLTFEAESSQADVAGTETSGSIITVTAVAAGTTTITVTATDPGGLAVAQSFEVTVPNRAPEITNTIPPLELAAGNDTTVDVSGYFSDPDEDPLTFEAESSQADVAGTETSGSIITVTAVAAGTTTITVTATDPGGVGVAQSFDVTVPNRAPEITDTIPALELAVGNDTTVDVSGYFSDPDEDPLTFEAESSQAGVAGTETSGSIITVTAVAAGTTTITVTATDPGGLGVAQSFDVTVPNRAPEITDTIPSVEVEAGDEATVDVSEYFSDPDEDPLTFEAESSQADVAGTETSGSIITVTAVAAGTTTITVTATDPGGLGVAQSFDVTVPNRAPHITNTIPPLELVGGGDDTVDASDYFSDPDGDPLTFAAGSSNPGVAEVSVSGSSVTVTPVTRGAATITVTATDPAGLEAFQDFEVTVNNGSPTVTRAVPPLTLSVRGEDAVDATAHFSDPDGDPLTFDAGSSDPGVVTTSLAGSVVTIRGVAIGTATITISAADPDGLEAATRFEVTVANRPPWVVGTIPPSVLAPGDEASRNMSPYIRDPDGDPLTFDATSSDPAVVTADVSGSSVILKAFATGSATITVTGTDPGGLQASGSFEVTVPDNTPPLPVGTMPDIELLRGGQVNLDLSSYFTDPDGDVLRYSASSSDDRVASATALGVTLIVTGGTEGSALVTVTAHDPHGLTAEQSFEVKVKEHDTGGFAMDVYFTASVTSSQRNDIADAAGLWATILAENELDDVPVNDHLRCLNLRTAAQVDAVDDFAILVDVDPVDGPGGTLAWAGMCGIRASGLPYLAIAVFDAADVQLMVDNGDLREVAVHELAHAFGFGLLWGDYLQNPSRGQPAPRDTHFSGPAAVAAFDAAGGADYRGGKVPVDNDVESGDRHWRESVFPTELMGPFNTIGLREPLSVISIQSMADLGYKVDASLGSPYPVSADIGAERGGRVMPLGDDTRILPLRIVDEEGRVIRVIGTGGAEASEAGDSAVETAVLERVRPKSGTARPPPERGRR
ncbi:Ig-like domain-containing protein [Candidatus Palauibacter sp.]|uniref:Ig-like domain-containing protein n=1 Tax=Candidatus Palauibacter sp. TaxID=3101350 RepID=UPI003B01541C